MRRAVTREDDRPNAVEYAAVGLLSPQETVPRIIRVNHVPGDPVTRIVTIRIGALAGTCASTRRVERCDVAVLIPCEAVIRIARVNVPSRDRARRIDVCDKRALAGACASGRNIEKGESAVRGTLSAMRHIV